MAGVENIAHLLLAEIDAIKSNLDTRNNRQAAFGCIGDRSERIDRRNLKWKFDATDAGKVGGKHQQIGWVPKRRECPGKREREGEPFNRIVAFGDCEHLVFEPDHDPGVDLE